ncbi:MAG: 16S rRNA (adenine(1518)-N(6)/adenine(1519)-N(6))-dimethyltransferase RsmA [Actinomycetota bacterium]|nr:16S rRNA (adenine(1518)-N(6)/adenine(1519)-N(6))-dimethyltransferase RsmA [Actinomycetota bacterium]
MTLTRREVLHLLDRHELRPSRALGQNFVADPNTVRRIARLAKVGPGDRVLEVGAGLGSLSLALAETGAEVTAIERDRRLLPVLRPLVEPAGVRVLQGDALSLDWHDVLGGEGGWVMVSNLPYNVAVPLVLGLLQKAAAISRMLVMVQREVAARLAAGVGDDGYGAVSVKVAYRATATVVGRVPATVFVPRPRVESSLVAVERLVHPAVRAEEGRLLALVSAGFAHRRKMLRRALSGLVGTEVLVAAGIDPEARAEELDIQAWGRLAQCATDNEPSPS